MRYSRRRLTITAIVAAVGCGAIVVFGWFLVGRTVDEADAYAGVAAGLLAALTAVSASVTMLVRWSRHPQPGARTPDGQVVFGVIPREARWFQRRPVEWAALDKALAGKGRAGVAALPGARGAGKTQLAAAYARRCVADGYDVVAWINAQSIPDEETGDRLPGLLGPVAELARLGAALGLEVADRAPEQIAAGAIQALGAMDGKRRLLVLDNVDDPDSIADYLPSMGTTKVVITTNRREVTTMAGVTPVRVGMFTEAQGRDFLSRATGLADTEPARALGEDVDWLPLGLAQAAAVIVLNEWTYDDYRRRLAEVDVGSALARVAGAQHPGVLAATRLSLQALRLDDPEGDSERLLVVLSLLAPEGVGRTLLNKPEVAAALEMTGLRMDRALGRLANLSLIAFGRSENVFVHRLTAKVIRHVVAGAEGRLPDAAVTRAATALLALFGRLSMHEVALRRSELDELVAHTLALHGHAGQATTALLRLANQAGRRLTAIGDTPRAIALHERNLADCERVLGADHSDTLASRNNLAASLFAVGRDAEAIELHERNLADRERVLGAEHPDTLASRNNLAASLSALGRDGEAIELHERNLADRERVLGAEHPDTLASRNNLAASLSAVGRHDEAIELHERNLADRKRVLGADHPDTLTARNNLAACLSAVGRHDEAIELHERNLADRERVLGAEHPSTLNSRNNLAASYRAVGRHDEAIAVHERNLADYERLLGAEHPDTLGSRHNLARAKADARRPR